MDEIDVILSLPHDPAYTNEDRWRDFKQLFLGSDQGRRVLRELMSWGGLLRPTVLTSPIDPYHTHVREGERNNALRVLYTITNEPKAKPAKTQSRRPTHA